MLNNWTKAMLLISCLALIVTALPQEYNFTITLEVIDETYVDSYGNRWYRANETGKSCTETCAELGKACVPNKQDVNCGFCQFLKPEFSCYDKGSSAEAYVPGYDSFRCEWSSLNGNECDSTAHSAYTRLCVCEDTVTTTTTTLPTTTTTTTLASGGGGNYVPPLQEAPVPEVIEPIEEIEPVEGVTDLLSTAKDIPPVWFFAAAIGAWWMFASNKNED